MKRAVHLAPFGGRQYLLPAFAEQVFTSVRRLGGTSAELAIVLKEGYLAAVRMGAPDQLSHIVDQLMSITVYQGYRKASASTTDFTENSIQSTIERACRASAVTHEDQYAGLADASLMAKSPPDLHLYYPWDMEPEQAFELACECEATAFGLDKRLTNSEGVTIEVGKEQMVYANTHGFWGSYPSSLYSMTCVLIAQDNGDKQSDYEYTSARDPKRLMDSKLLARLSAKATLNRLNPKQIPTQTCSVIFSPRIARRFFGHFVSAITGSRLYRQASFLQDSLGQQLFQPFIRIEEKPHQIGAIGSAPFDDEGVATQSARCIVESGKLQTYVLDSYSARKLNMQTTGNAGGVHNLVVSHSNDDLKALMKQMGKGLLVVDLMGDGVNLVTGDYSQGAFGYWVESGEVRHPVSGITIAGNLKDMFLNTQAVANDIDYRGNIQTGSVLISDMTVASRK